MICNNKYWRVILQPQDIALLSEGGAGSPLKSLKLKSPPPCPHLCWDLYSETASSLWVFSGADVAVPGQPEGAFTVYWHSLWSLSSTHCMYKSQWVKSAVQHEYVWLPGDKSPLSLDKIYSASWQPQKQKTFPGNSFHKMSQSSAKCYTDHSAGELRAIKQSR